MWNYAVIARAQSRMRECVSLEEKGFSEYSSTVQRNQDAHRTPCWLIHQLQWSFINFSSQGKLNVALGSFVLWHQTRSCPLQGSVFKRGFRTTGLKSELEAREGYLQAT